MARAPSSILIVGSGVFGLGTAYALTQRPLFDNTTITVVDCADGQFPPEDSASVDSSRIIRADYSDRDYAALAAEAQQQWRQQADHEVGGEGRYSESGLLLCADTPPKDYSYKKCGMDYTKESWKNVMEIAKETGLPQDKIQLLESTQAMQNFLKTDGHPGDWGYINNLSGWADAGKGMKWLYEKTKATGRVNFVDAKVEELVTEGEQVTGVKLADSRVFKADVVFVAAGAWTGSLVDLRGRSEATGHPVAYVAISPEEEKALERLPVVLNLSTGLFVIPPRDGLLKFARHDFGYVNPTTITRALPVSHKAKRETFLASQPYTSRVDASDPFPAEADQDLRRALTDLIPIRGLENRPWKKTRICWYADTRDGEWLVDWHPGWKGLFIATGDSGHGFKFLPNLGDKIVDVLLGEGGRLAEKWRWREMPNDGAGRETDGVYKGLITEDGSRGGQMLVLKDELAKGKAQNILKAKL
ncbi:FAD dependent oxidoreductase [Ilyonectria robusta]|uniref:FAD dependent oxidoreductase n=1 Tax=Ilyonectria robusta TaxID=1079257 RepID=UPI001E8D7E97|nr:FAD dependent oxidoreductase [Ilyonectria robusta]KAH8729342.1 FAD dependent oxidoreductase [Ilyonectria robusta]